MSEGRAEPNTEAPKPGPSTPRPRSKWRRRILIALAVIPALVLTALVGGYFYALKIADDTLRDAIAEADRLDPDWRLEEIEARREDIPPEENAAERVARARDLIPDDWLSNSPQVRQSLGPFRGTSLVDRLNGPPPNVCLGPEEAAGAAADVAELADALAEARPLAEMGRGRPPIEYDEVYVQTPLRFAEESRKVVRMLWLGAIDRAQRGDCDGALADCRAILGVARSLGDEPFLISQLVRNAEVSIAVVSTQRVLGQGEATDDGLARIQACFAEEAKTPYSLIAFRGERAGSFDMMGKLAEGAIPISALSGDGPVAGPMPRQRNSPHGRAFFRYNQGLTLHILNEAVEISRLPLHEQADRWRAWSALTDRPKQRWRFLAGAMTYLLIPAVEQFSAAHHRIDGWLGVAQVMIAMERFRLARGRWPESPDEIPKSILPEVPIDPYCGEPIRVRRAEDGWIVYTVGPDGRDDGANLDPKCRLGISGTDWGFRLWDVAARRLAPPPATETNLGSPDEPEPTAEPNP